MSCSLPLPPAIFWASVIWERTLWKCEESTLALLSTETEFEKTYVDAEVLKRVTLNSVDAQLGVGLNNGESTRHCPKLMLVISLISYVLFDSTHIGWDLICVGDRTYGKTSCWHRPPP